jgi:hypothetical protein
VAGLSCRRSISNAEYKDRQPTFSDSNLYYIKPTITHAMTDELDFLALRIKSFPELVAWVVFADLLFKDAFLAINFEGD